MLMHMISISVGVMSGFAALANAVRYGVKGENFAWMIAHGLICGMNLSFVFP